MSQESAKPDETPSNAARAVTSPAAVSEESAKPVETPAPVSEQPPPPSKPGKGTRIGAIIVLVLIVASLAWYFVSDRLTPYTSQARVQAFVVPVAAEVSGTVLKVHVKNNDEVQRGQPLFDIDPTQYQIALQRSRSDYESVRLSVNASTAAVEAAKAALQAAIANDVYAQQDATRLEQIHTEDPGAISVRRVESAQATRIKARSQVEAARADLRRAQETAGETRRQQRATDQCPRGDREGRAGSEAHRRCVAPARGPVTDLRTDVGQFAQAGAAGDDADRHSRPLDQRRHDREQSRQHQARRRGGDRARRDAGPGVEGTRAQRRHRGRFRPAGAARHPACDRQQPRLAAPGAALPGGRRVRPVRTRATAWRCASAGQADVLIYTGEYDLMNWLGAASSSG